MEDDMTVIEFLLARIAEMERAASAWHTEDDGRPKFFRVAQPDGSWLEVVSPVLIRAECAAKRDLVVHAGFLDQFDPQFGDFILKALATVYADHPDFHEEWRV